MSVLTQAALQAFFETRGLAGMSATSAVGNVTVHLAAC